MKSSLTKKSRSPVDYMLRLFRSKAINTLRVASIITSLDLGNVQCVRRVLNTFLEVIKLKNRFLSIMSSVDAALIHGFKLTAERSDTVPVDFIAPFVSPHPALQRSSLLPSDGRKFAFFFRFEKELAETERGARVLVQRETGRRGERTNLHFYLHRTICDSI